VPWFDHGWIGSDSLWKVGELTTNIKIGTSKGKEKKYIYNFFKVLAAPAGSWASSTASRSLDWQAGGLRSVGLFFINFLNLIHPTGPGPRQQPGWFLFFTFFFLEKKKLLGFPEKGATGSKVDQLDQLGQLVRCVRFFFF
jgi:hypothetical protein